MISLNRYVMLLFVLLLVSIIVMNFTNNTTTYNYYISRASGTVKRIDEKRINDVRSDILHNGLTIVHPGTDHSPGTKTTHDKPHPGTFFKESSLNFVDDFVTVTYQGYTEGPNFILQYYGADDDSQRYNNIKFRVITKQINGINIYKYYVSYKYHNNSDTTPISGIVNNFYGGNKCSVPLGVGQFQFDTTNTNIYDIEIPIAPSSVTEERTGSFTIVIKSYSADLASKSFNYPNLESFLVTS